MKKISLILLILLLFNLVGCTTETSSMPEVFQNKEVYKDMVSFVRNIEKAIKTNDVKHEENGYEILFKYYDDVKDLILTKVTLSDGFPKNNIVLTIQEKEIISMAYDIMFNLGMYLDKELELNSMEGTLNKNNTWSDNLMEELEKFTTKSSISINL